jgi:hypothetical protein
MANGLPTCQDRVDRRCSSVHEAACCVFRDKRAPVKLARAQLMATRAHRDQQQPMGEPLITHVRRVAAATPEFARPVAWLHEIFEWTSVSEEKLLAYGASDDELRALRLLTRTLGGSSESGYLAHVTMIARADGPAGVLARTVKVSDLKDRLHHLRPGTGGSRPPYERALQLILAAETPQGLPSSGGAESPAA